MDCPTDEGLIRTKLGSLSQVQSLQFNLMLHKLVVEHAGPAAHTSQIRCRRRTARSLGGCHGCQPRLLRQYRVLHPDAGLLFLSLSGR